MTTLLQWIVLSHRYRYASNNSGIASLMGIVGGFALASVLIWLVFHYGVEESRLSVWIAGCAVAGFIGGVVIYRVMLPYGLCWLWSGC